VDRRQVPPAQYGAVLIDEGHDFEPEWLKLAVQMVHPYTSSLLVLYDDAQSIYGKRRSFSFKSVGVQAQGRTTVLRLNYRNSAEILQVAYEFAKSVLTPHDTDEDGVPLLRPESAERHGPVPDLVGCQSLAAEASFVARRLAELHARGKPWGEMAILYRWAFVEREVSKSLQAAGIPASVLNRVKGRAASDTVKLVTFHSSKGLEFPGRGDPGLRLPPGRSRRRGARAALGLRGDDARDGRADHDAPSGVGVRAARGRVRSETPRRLVVVVKVGAFSLDGARNRR
jgi:superfamily I DNA/RNA helicase